jgi:hypothetical protein
MGSTVPATYRERALEEFMTALNLLKEMLPPGSCELLRETNFPDPSSLNTLGAKASLLEDALERIVEAQKKHKQENKTIMKEVLLQWFRKSEPLVTRFLSVAQSASSVSPPCVQVHSLTLIFRSAP